MGMRKRIPGGTCNAQPMFEQIAITHHNLPSPKTLPARMSNRSPSFEIYWRVGMSPFCNANLILLWALALLNVLPITWSFWYLLIGI